MAKDTNVEKDLTNADPTGADADATGGAAVEADATTESVSAPVEGAGKSTSVKAGVKLGQKVKLMFKHDMRHPFLNEGKGHTFDKDEVVTVELDSWLVHQIDAHLVEVLK